MAEIRQDLKLQSDPSTIVRPNIITDCIPDGVVTHAKLDTDAVEDVNIRDFSVTENKVMDGAITSDKVASGAVTGTKIASDAVTSDKIGSGAVTEAKIANRAIRFDKLNFYENYLLSDYIISWGDDEITPRMLWDIFLSVRTHCGVVVYVDDFLNESEVIPNIWYDKSAQEVNIEFPSSVALPVKSYISGSSMIIDSTKVEDFLTDCGNTFVIYAMNGSTLYH